MKVLINSIGKTSSQGDSIALSLNLYTSLLAICLFVAFAHLYSPCNGAPASPEVKRINGAVATFAYFQVPLPWETSLLTKVEAGVSPSCQEEFIETEIEVLLQTYSAQIRVAIPEIASLTELPPCTIAIVKVTDPIHGAVSILVIHDGGGVIDVLIEDF